MRLKIIFILIFVLFVSSCSEKILEVSPAEVDKTIKYKDKNITFKEKDDKDFCLLNGLITNPRVPREEVCSKTI